MSKVHLLEDRRISELVRPGEDGNFSDLFN